MLLKAAATLLSRGWRACPRHLVSESPSGLYGTPMASLREQGNAAFAAGNWAAAVDLYTQAIQAAGAPDAALHRLAG
jgi:hypothetical protein